MAPRRALTTVAAAFLALAPLLAVAMPAVSTVAPSRRITASDTLHIQFAGTLDRSVNASVFEVDCADTPASVVADLHARGKTVIGYVDAGSWENYRADAGAFPQRVLGRVMDGWPDERWLDIRKMGVLKPIMRARMDVCVRKGFDAIEFDNVDGYSNRTGFPLSKQNQVRYDSWLARAASYRGLQPGLKNTVELIPELVSHFDWALNEQCVQYSECGRYRPFVRAGKAVFVLEYRVSVARMCAVTKPLGLMAQKKHLSLDAWRRTCP